MKAKPEKGQRLLLLCHAQSSRTGFSVEVECIGAADPAAGGFAKKAEVIVMFPNGDAVHVTRGDVEPAE